MMRRAISALAALTVLVGAARAAHAHLIEVPEDYPTIQAAVDAAAKGDKIRIAAGTYAESIQWSGKAITLIGAGQGASIIDPSRGPGGRCLTLVDVPSGGRVEDLTCQNGAAGAASDPDGGGMLIRGGGHLTVKRVTFRQNAANRNGGGGWIDGGDVSVLESSFLNNEGDSGGRGGGLGSTNGSRVRVVRSTFSGGFANPQGGGLAVLGGSSATVIDSHFEGNFGRSGGGIWSADSTLGVFDSVFSNNVSDFAGAALGAITSHVTVADSTFAGNVSDSRNEHVIYVTGKLKMVRSSVTNNTGGGIDATGDLEVRDCSFANNTAKRGGAILAAGNVVSVTNCAFFANMANGVGGLNPIPAQGGAISAGGGDVQVTQCTFYGNTAMGYKPPNEGGGLYVSSESAVLNSIFWGDAPTEIAGPGTAAITYSDVMGGYPGTGNIDQDPLFVAPGAGDLHLEPDSPARDAGLFTCSLPPTDLDGNPRVVGAAPDMGAYEVIADEEEQE